jgi:murein DD-endopeptidase MepM/ murein hydrolase activator NlpD
MQTHRKHSSRNAGTLSRVLTAVFSLLTVCGIGLLLLNHFETSSHSLQESAAPTTLSLPLPLPEPASAPEPTPVQNTQTELTPPQPQSRFLFASSDEEKMSPRLYAQLQRIFKNVVRLNAQSQKTGRFNVLYNRQGYIELATVTLHHRTYQAVRFTDSHGHTGYYSPNGQALSASGFLTAPVKYERISDPFTSHRWHPILHIFRPHKGIDYAAPAGTPVHAVGSGQVNFAGWNGGYGNVVEIDHNSRYQTLYAHLSHISQAVKPGQWVKKGQIIGYVGSTGLATGPNLHFGLYDYGRPVNPQTVLPRLSVPVMIAQRDKPAFSAKINQLLTHLAVLQKRTLNA